MKMKKLIEGKLDEDGCLFVLRAVTLKHQYCPLTVNKGMHDYCGDWCSLFGEPQSYNKGVRLDLHCAKTAGIVWTFDKFRDEREQQKTPT